MDELALLQAVRLKGRTRHADLAATLDVEQALVDAAVEEFASAGLLALGKTVRLSQEGKDRLAALLVDERRALDLETIQRYYDEFLPTNREFKALVSQWQLRDGEPNDHTDAEYDAEVLSGLDDVHDAILPILTSVSGQVPRLKGYAAKLSAALDRVRSGDTAWFTRPLVDSYHTVWFELHEELLGAAGLTRNAEASAGHAE